MSTLNYLEKSTQSAPRVMWTSPITAFYVIVQCMIVSPCIVCADSDSELGAQLSDTIRKGDANKRQNKPGIAISEYNAALRLLPKAGLGESEEEQTRVKLLGTIHTLYDGLMEAIEEQRSALEGDYDNSEGRSREKVQRTAHDYLYEVLVSQVFPSWMGTDWEFYGDSEYPSSGPIACGYFVTTVLRDAGFRIPRVKLAQLPSEAMIQWVVQPEDMTRFRHCSLEGFVEAIKERGKGIFIVGLDHHTGFIWSTGDEVYFVHSNYLDPRMVVTERARDSRALEDSNYRVVGDLLSSHTVERWIQGR